MLGPAACWYRARDGAEAAQVGQRCVGAPARGFQDVGAAAEDGYDNGDGEGVRVTSHAGYGAAYQRGLVHAARHGGATIILCRY